MKKYSIFSNVTGNYMYYIEAHSFGYNGKAIEFYRTTMNNIRTVVGVISIENQSFIVD